MSYTNFFLGSLTVAGALTGLLFVALSVSPRSRQRLNHRWPFLLPLIAALYGLQTVIAFTATSSQQAQRAAATLVMIFFAVGIARSWELLGVRGGGLLDLLAARADRPDHADSPGTSVSATLAADETARRLRAQGVDVLPLGFGQAGIPVHPLLRQAIADAAERNGYGSVAGSDELRQAAAGYWRRRGLETVQDQVLAGPGSKALLYAAVQAIGGDVVVARPSWVSYAAQIRMLGNRPIYVPAQPGEGGVPAPDQLAESVRRARASGRKVRAVIATVPDNPTGTMASARTVDLVCAIARDLDLVVISDEIYRDLVYRDPFRSPAEFAPERVVITSGLSKSLALGGWRIGFTRLPDGEIGSRLSARMLSAASEIWSGVPQPFRAGSGPVGRGTRGSDRVGASRPAA